LLDRFGLYVEVKGEKDVSLRVAIMKRRIAFEEKTLHFIESYLEDTQVLSGRIASAKTLLSEVVVTGNAQRFAATLAENSHCAGHRGEIVIIETAKAIAAFDGRWMLTIEDMKEAAEYALAHRMQTLPSAMQEHQNQDDEQKERDQELPEPKTNQNEEQSETRDEQSYQAPDPDVLQSENPKEYDSDNTVAQHDKGDDIQEAGEPFLIPRWLDPQIMHKINKGSGRRNIVRSATNQGRYVNHRMPGSERVVDLAFDATVRAAAPYQNMRNKDGRAIAIESDDLRVKIRERRTGGCILFVVDASASMGTNKRMKEVKAAILSMLNVSYQKRDKVGLIAFRKDSAELLLGITRSVELAERKLALLPTGGKTPLSKGLDLAYEVIMGLKMKDPDATPTLVLVSDGRASGKKTPNSNPFNDALKSAQRIGNQNINTIVLNTENGFIKFNLCEKLNEKLHGTLLTMEEMKADGIVEAIARYR
jgi:magnesium chelatase subunit D